MGRDHLLLLSHGELTKKMVGAHRGEIANALKFHRLLKKQNYNTSLFDIFEFFDGNIHSLYHPLGHLNIKLAEHNISVLDETALPEGCRVIQRILEYKPEVLFLLSWEWSLGALFGLGIQKKCPTASKLYVHHNEVNVMTKLFETSDLLLTESLLANECAIKAGIPPWKLIFLPHHYTQSSRKPSREYLEKLAQKKGKKIHLTQETVVIGSISRMSFGKNCEFLLEACVNLKKSGKDILFIFKGDVETHPPYPTYNERIKQAFETFENEEWFLWDREISTYEEMLSIFASFDLFMHLTSADAGSNVIVEALSMGIPTITLDASTNFSLFKDAACFIKRKEKGLDESHIPYQLPCRDDLLEKLGELVDNPSLREELGKKGQEIAHFRFNPQKTFERMPLIIEASKGYHKGKNVAEIQTQVLKLFESDLTDYSLQT